jgi:hypothetical protein
MILDNWAQRWSIPPAAIAELRAALGQFDEPVSKPGTSEGFNQQAIRLAAPGHGCRLMRNNRGAAVDPSGRHIRYGLANDSKEMDRRIKSSDLIGIESYLVLPQDVGRTLGLFRAVEVKKSNWKYTGNEREVAQLAFLNLIISMGGLACFARSPEEVWVNG